LLTAKKGPAGELESVESGPQRRRGRRRGNRDRGARRNRHGREARHGHLVEGWGRSIEGTPRLGQQGIDARGPRRRGCRHGCGIIDRDDEWALLLFVGSRRIWHGWLCERDRLDGREL